MNFDSTFGPAGLAADRTLLVEELIDDD